MRALVIQGTKRTIDKLVRLYKQAMREGAYRVARSEDCTPWCSIWKGGQLPKSPVSSKCTGPKSPSGCSAGNDGECLGFWRDTDLDSLKELRIRNGRSWQTFWAPGSWLMDFSRGAGPARWFPGLLRKNFRFSTIPPMFLVSFETWDSPFSVRRKSWLVLTSAPNRGGSGIAILTLKKSAKPRSSSPFRGRSHVPTGSYPLPNVGESRMPAPNSNHRSEEGLKSIWHDRTLYRPVPLSLSKSLRCFYVHRLSGEGDPELLSSENLPDPGQYVLPQGSGGLALAFRSAPLYRDLQSSVIFSRTQRLGRSLAFYSTPGNSQPLLGKLGGTLRFFNFYIPEYPESSVTGAGLFGSLQIAPINTDSGLFMQNYTLPQVKIPKLAK